MGTFMHRVHMGFSGASHGIRLNLLLNAARDTGLKIKDIVVNERCADTAGVTDCHHASLAKILRLYAETSVKGMHIVVIR